MIPEALSRWETCLWCSLIVKNGKGSSIGKFEIFFIHRITDNLNVETYNIESIM